MLAKATMKIKVFYHHWLAVSLENHTDHIAIKHVKALAKLENDWGLLDLGCRYSDGKSVGQSYSKALFYYKKSFDQKGKYAQYSATNSCKRDTHFLELGWVSCELAPYKLGKLRSPLRSRAFE